MKSNQKLILAGTVVLMLSACSSEPVRDESYQFADSVRTLVLPPNLLAPDANLVMEFPLPSFKACEKLFEADERFQVEAKRKLAEQQAAKLKEGEQNKAVDKHE